MRRALSRSRQRIAPARLGVVAIAVAGALAWAGCDTSENADTDRGRALFQSNCGTCHTLAQAGTSANVGPNLDAAFAQARSDGMDNDTIEGVVQTQIESPRYIEKGASNYSRVYMPAEHRHGPGRRGRRHLRRAASPACPAPSRRSSRPPDLFTQKCGICHALAAAGTLGHAAPTSTTALAGKDAAFIEKSIVDPNAEIAQGFQPDIMPQDFQTTLSPQDLKGLVNYLLDHAGKSGSSSEAAG